MNVTAGFGTVWFTSKDQDYVIGERANAYELLRLLEEHLRTSEEDPYYLAWIRVPPCRR